MEVGRGRIEYVVTKGTSRRYTYFRFRPDLTLEVVLPRGGRADAEAAIRAKLRWIVREYEAMASTRRILGPDHVMFGGSYYEIVFTKGPREGLFFDGEAGMVAVASSDRRRMKELIRRWFLKETSTYVVKKVAELAPTIGAKPSRVDVREISKWGYCTRTGRLSFSWQLAALPESLREYVVLHELVHLREFNHSKAFKSMLSSFCPDCREREKELDTILPYDGKTLD